MRSLTRLLLYLIVIAVAALSVERLSAAEPGAAGIFVEDPQTKTETKLEATLMAVRGPGGRRVDLHRGVGETEGGLEFGGAHAEPRLAAQPVFRFRFDPKANTPPQDPAAMMAMMMGGGPALPPSARARTSSSSWCSTSARTLAN